MHASGPTFSVVLSTYNRGALLGDAIRSLLSLDPASPSHELIIVDNNSRDHTRELVEGLIPESNGRLRYVFEGRQGLSHGRNAGIAASRGSIIVFTDDDVRAGPDWLIALARAFEAHPGASFVGGKVLPMWPCPPPAWLDRHNWSPLALVDYGEQGFETSTERAICLVGANLAFRREVFDQFGGFDPRYQHEPGANSAVEDHEFELRLYMAGLRGWYEPSAVIHAEVQPNRLTKAYHRRWHYWHGRAMVRMLPPGQHYDSRGVFTPLPANARLFLGAPLYLYRGLVTHVGATARAALAGKPSRSFHFEGQVREVFGMLRFYAILRGRLTPSSGTIFAPRIHDYAMAGSDLEGEQDRRVR